MADSKLSELGLATGASSSDLLYVVQSNVSKKITASSLAVTLAGLNISSQTVTYSTSAGVRGSVRYDANYIYFCVDTNSWIRANRNNSW
jgi:hypothetical protein